MKDDVLFELKQAAMKTGEMLRQAQKSLATLEVRYKNPQKFKGVVSDADHRAEDMIASHLKEKFPSIPLLSEEMAHAQNIQDFRPFDEMPFCFVVDPLDGSNNFVHGLDYYCISLALLAKGKPLVGVVFRPATGELFQAVEGEQSWYNSSLKEEKKRLFVKTQSRPLESCLVATGHRPPQGFFHNTRQMGSAALDLCYVAAQKFDAYYARGLSPWDVAACAVILAEANVITTDFEGQELNCFGQTFLAAPDGIHQQLREMF